MSRQVAPCRMRPSQAGSAGAGVAPGEIAVAHEVTDRALEHHLVAGATRAQLEQPGQVEVRVGRAEIDLDRALVGRDRLGVATLILDGNPQVEPVQRDAGLSADRQAIAALGQRRRTRVVVQPPEVVMGIAEHRTAGEGAFVRCDRPGRVGELQATGCVVPAGRTRAAAKSEACSGRQPAQARSPESRADRECQKITHVCNAIGTL